MMHTTIDVPGIRTIAVTLDAFPNEQAYHVDVAWTGNDLEGFNTSHLGFSQSTNLVRSAYGQAYRP